MADRTVLTPITLPADYATTPVEITWTAADDTNKNRFIATGKEILLVHNENAGAQTVTVSSVACEHSRTGDATKEIPAGKYYVFQLFPLTGWMQTTGYIHVDAASADVKFAVLRLP